MKLGTLLLLMACLFFETSSAQEWVWSRYGSCNGTGSQEGAGVAVVPPVAGPYIYASGYYNSSLIFPGTAFNFTDSTVEGFPFLTKYDTAGNLIWARVGFAQIFAEPVLVAADAQGNAYLAGSSNYVNTVFGPDTVYCPPLKTNFFLVKYDSSGNVKWARGASGNFVEAMVNGVTCDRKGNVWITGAYRGGAVKFDSITLPVSYYNSINSHDDSVNTYYFTAAYDSSGNLLFVDCPADTNFSYGMAVATNPLDPEGAVYVTGAFLSRSLKTGQIVLTNSDTSGATSSCFIIKYDSLGHVLWSRNSVSLKGSLVGGAVQPAAIAADKHGNVYVTGYFQDQAAIFGGDTVWDSPVYARDAFIVKYDAYGNAKWVVGGTQAHVCGGVALSCDTTGNVYMIIGGYYDSLDMEGIQLRCPIDSYEPAYLLKFDTAGNITWHNILSGGGDDWIGIATDISGNAYVSGDYAEPIVIGADSLPLCGVDESFFIAKLAVHSCSTGAISIIGDSVICNGDTANICAPAGYTNYQWSNDSTGTCIQTPLGGAYYVTAIDSGGCPLISNQLNISFFQPVPVIIQGSGDTLSCSSAVSCQWYRDGQPLPGDTTNIFIATQPGTYLVTIKDQHGCYYNSSPVVTGINEVPVSDNIIIYPNPSTASWHLTVSPELLGSTVLVFDVTGRLAFKGEVRSGKSEIAIPNAAIGVYELHLISPQGIFVRKLVKI